MGLSFLGARETGQRQLIYLAYGIVALLCLLFSFRYFIASGFDRLAGDDGDAKLIMAQLEHWRAVLAGRAWYDSPIWFYPVKHILGIQDGLLLNGLTHSAARLVFDEHASLEVGAMLASLIGFAGTALLLHRGLRMSVWVALWGAAFFVIQGSLYRMHHAPQMATVFYFPLLGFLLLASLTHRETRLHAFALPAAALLFVAMWWSTFYVAWYATLFLILLALICLTIALYRAGWRTSLQASLAFAKERRCEIAGGAVPLVIGGIAFTSLYLPHLRRQGGWPYQVIDERLLHVTDLVVATPDNWLWGYAVGGGDPPDVFGFPPLFGLLCFAGVVWCTIRVLQRSRPLNVLELYCCATGIAAFLLWFCFLKIGDWTIYKYVYRYVPGAAAMRVPVRLNLFLAAVLAPIVVIVIQAIWNAGRGKPAVRALAVAIACLAFAEQGTSREVSYWSRKKDRALLASIPAPPGYCRSFFVSWTIPRPWDGPLLQYFYAPISDGMLLASRFRVPTLNGLGTAADDGWPAPPPMGDKYEETIGRWVYQHKLQRVCRLVLPTGSWHFYR
ncbi:MAG: hypothetical protein WDO17_22615 [Alphaproteobacteria bacterium]